MKKKPAVTLIAILAVLVIVFAAIHFTNNADKTKQIEALNADIADKAEQIEQISADSVDKANQIASLSADVSEKSDQIEALTADAAHQAGQIEELTATVSEKDEQINALTADAASKDIRIATLDAVNHAKESQIQDLSADVSDQSGQIEVLTADAARQAQQIEVLTVTVSEKDKEIIALTADTVGKDIRIVTLLSDISEREKTIEALNADIREKESQIEVLKAESQEKDDQIELLKEALAIDEPETEESAETGPENVEKAVEGAVEAVVEAVGAVGAAVEAVKEALVMPHAEYIAAENDTWVLIESYVQGHQSWWDNKVTVYLQDESGAYFAYELACSEEDAAKLVPGQKIRVKGYKSEWAGEVEIVDGVFEFVDAEPWIAEATDVTALLATDELINHMNEFVAVKGAVIAAYDENGAAFAYKNPEEKKDDLYFKVEVDGKVYEFCVESYLTGEDTDVYRAVEGLNVGDTVDLEGFLYWYNGANLQATGLTVK